jgi:hypothetical protein
VSSAPMAVPYHLECLAVFTGGFVHRAREIESLIVTEGREFLPYILFHVAVVHLPSTNHFKNDVVNNRYK